MKKSLLLFALVLLLAGCASTGNQAALAGGTPAGSPSEEPGLTAGAPEKMTCRIVDGAEEGELVLAGPGARGTCIPWIQRGWRWMGPWLTGRWWRSGLTE